MTTNTIPFREALGLEVRTGHELHSRDGSSVLEYTYVLCLITMPPIELISVGSSRTRMYLEGVVDSVCVDSGSSSVYAYGRTEEEVMNNAVRYMKSFLVEDNLIDISKFLKPE